MVYQRDNYAIFSNKSSKNDTPLGIYGLQELA
jgi:hypothetical protein